MVSWLSVSDVVPAVVKRLLRAVSNALFFAVAALTGVAGAGGVARAATAGAGARRRTARGFGLGFAPVTLSSGSATCALTVAPKPVTAKSAATSE